jgi:hypothetical protein
MNGLVWFPELTNEERVLVFVHARQGHLVNLDGSSPKESLTEGVFYRKCRNRQEALDWAGPHRPKVDVLCLLYDRSRKEEWVALGQPDQTSN